MRAGVQTYSGLERRRRHALIPSLVAENTVRKAARAAPTVSSVEAEAGPAAAVPVAVSYAPSSRPSLEHSLSFHSRNIAFSFRNKQDESKRSGEILAVADRLRGGGPGNRVSQLHLG